MKMLLRRRDDSIATIAALLALKRANWRLYAQLGAAAIALVASAGSGPGGWFRDLVFHQQRQLEHAG